MFVKVPIETGDRIFLMLEYCSGGDLAGYINLHGKVSEAVAKHFMRQLALGLQVLQEKHFIHRDLKPQNLLLSSKEVTPLLKIEDFGFASLWSFSESKRLIFSLLPMWLLEEGLDIIGVQTVINYACPREIDSYVHRVGRTARAEREGYAVTFVTDNDRSLLKVIAKKVGSKLKSRIIPEHSIVKWSQIIDEMEDQYSAVIGEEREERALRKAEMEFAKAENMIEHIDEIYARGRTFSSFN